MTAPIDFGRLPGGWRMGRIKDLVGSGVNGVWGDEPKDDGHDVHCVRAADFDRDSLRVRPDRLPLRSVDARTRGRHLLRRGDLVWEKSGGGDTQPVGLAAVFDLDVAAVCSNFCTRVTPAPSADPRYLAYVFAAAYHLGLNKRSIKQTTGLQNMDGSSFLSEAWPIPGLAEQRRIADLLDAATAGAATVRATRNRQLAALRERRFALVREQLAGGLDGHAGSRQTGPGWLPSCPEHWRLLPLKRVTRCLDGRRIPLSATERAGRSGPYPYYGASSIVDRVDDYLFDEPLVLLGEDGARLGNPLLEVAFHVEGRIWVNNHAHVLRPAGVDGRFLTHVLNVFDRELCLSGSTREKITQEAMGNLIVPVPPPGEQVRLRESMDRAVTANTHLVEAMRRQIRLVDERLRAYVCSVVLTGA